MRREIKKRIGDFLDEHGAWWDSCFRVAFMNGVPGGVFVGAIAAAWIQVHGGANSAGKGVLIGAGTAVVGGLIVGMLFAGHYKSDRVEIDYKDKDRMIRMLNIGTARARYLLDRREGDYIVYRPTLTPPIAVGPLTLTPESLSVSVQLSEGTATINGPAWIVRQLCAAAKNAEGEDDFYMTYEEALEAAGLSE